MNKSCWIAIAIPVVLAGCGTPKDAAEDQAAATATAGDSVPGSEVGTTPTPQRATAILQTSDGKPAGTAIAPAVDGGVRLALQVEGLPAGQHGVHVHMIGKCDAPAFESAGSHWNPTDAKHGLDDPAGQHAGDMPNLVVEADGSGALSYSLQGATFDGLLDSDGSAMLVHAAADDQKTDPSGNSGNRIACGVFKAS